MSVPPHRQDTLYHVGEGDAKCRGGYADDAKRSHPHWFPAPHVIGQRHGDVLAMVRPKAGENVIAVTAQKTKKTVWIPIHTVYRKWIEKVPTSDSVMLHARVRTHAYASADSFRNEWQKMMDKEEFKRFRENRIVFHGLRKNAIINLLEVGCTENQAGAICNMSAQMVQH